MANKALQLTAEALPWVGLSPQPSAAPFSSGEMEPIEAALDSLPSNCSEHELTLPAGSAQSQINAAVGHGLIKLRAEDTYAEPRFAADSGGCQTG